MSEEAKNMWKCWAVSIPVAFVVFGSLFIAVYGGL